MYGRQATIPLDLIHPKPPPPTDNTGEAAFPVKAASYASKLVDRLAKAFETSQKGWSRDFEHKTRAYSGIAPDEFKPGVRVLVFTPSRTKSTSDKLQSPWTGPFRISKKVSDILYELQRDGPDSSLGRKAPVGIISLSRLKLYCNQSASNEGAQNSPQQDDDSSSNASSLETEATFPHEYEALFEARPPTSAQNEEEREGEGEEEE